MKKFIYNLLIFLPLFGFTQTSILNEDFSSDSDMTKSDSAGGAGAFFSDGSKDYYGIYSDTEANRDFDANGTGSTPSVANYSGYSGEYLVAEDVDGEGTISDPAFITWGPFNTATHTSLLFSLKIGASGAKFDSTDYVKLSYSTDNSNWTDVLGFENDGATYNTYMYQDTNLDGTGNGTQITTTLANFTHAIAEPDTSTLYVRLSVRVEAGDEEIAIDDLKVDGYNGLIWKTIPGSSAWETGSNWTSGSEPSSSDQVYLIGSSINPIISDGSLAEAQGLTILNGGSLVISKDGQLTVPGEILVDGSSQLIIESDSDESGSLIAKQASTPTITYKNYIYSAQWKLIGLPVSGEVVDDVDDNLLTSGSKTAIGFYDNDKSGGAGWDGFNTGSTDTSELINTRGYEIRRASSDGTVSFTGTMLNSDLTNVAITTENSPGNSWNLVGNPFPSYLRMTDDSGDTTNNFLKVNASAIDDTAEAIYGWDGTSYDIYDHDDDASGRPDLIAPGTGFFIYAASDTNVSFTEAMQVHSGGIGFHGSVVQGSQKTRKANVTIKMEDEFLSKKLRVLFNDKSSDGLDRGGDIRAFPFGESHIYMQLLEGYKDVDFAKQSLPYNKISETTIPLGIETPGGKMVLNFMENTLPEYIDMYLEDTKENTFKKINDGFEINFDEAYEGLGRFYLHFTDQLIPELPTDDNLRIYKGSDSDVMVMGAVGKNYSAKVYDYSGRLIKEVNFNHKTKINDLDSKMKILRIESEEGLTIKKFKLN